MKYTIFSDPHIGYKPKSHVTVASANAYRDKLRSTAMGIVESAKHPIIMLGDLFHLHTNPENIIKDGAEILSKCWIGLNGNHDVLNVAGSVSSFDLAWKMSSALTAFTHAKGDWSEIEAEDGSAHFYLCCHYYSQGDFEKAIRSVSAAKKDKKKNHYLLLHCNVSDGYGEDVDPDGHSLYLTAELQELVSKNFNRILVGHEHVSRNIGNIQLVGNTFPLSFGEMADRYTWELDTKADTLTKTRSLEINKHFIEVEFGSGAKLPKSTYWVDVKGEIPKEGRKDVHTWIARLWKDNPGLLSVRNNVEFVGVDKAKADTVSSLSVLEQVMSAAQEAGFGKELKELQNAGA